MAIIQKGRVAAPRPPEPSPPFRIPVLATIAPVIAALAMWLLTRSPFALVFAALGPVTAVASLADSRIGSRRTARREARRFTRETGETLGQIESAHALERLANSEITPAARSIIGRPGADPYRWRAVAGAPMLVTVGSGEAGSALEFERGTRQPSPSASVAEALDRLEHAASTLAAAPVTVDARLGIGVFGPLPLATAVGRAIALQLAWALTPNEHWWSACGQEGEWMSLLPHRRGPGASRSGWGVEFGEVGEELPLVIVVAGASEADLPGACGVVVRAGGETGSAIVQHPQRERRAPVRVEAVSLDEAAGWAQSATLQAQREGLVAAESLVPSRVALEALPNRPTGGTLACAIAADAEGAVVVDLVAHGPHAVIGGTTGSGKSELLVSWVIAMAGAYSPDDVNFLLIDFKGGSAFAALAALPHTAGIITDLDEQQAARALASLKAELRYRERELAGAGAKSIDGGAAIPRLVIIVDEFAAMLADHPGLHALFADIAARGRSLGVHLVLCTQRPAGVVRDSVLANADLRVSLRVNNRADSSAVVGTDAAASIPAQARGRGILSLAGGPPRLVQFAIAGAADADGAVSRWAGSSPIRRPWCDPLPSSVPIAQLAGGQRGFDAICFGIEDVPDEQRIGPAVWHPARDGHLLVLGAAGSGKSTALEAIAAHGEPVWLPAAVDAAWDVLAELERVEAGERLVLFDDLDSLLSRFAVEYRQVFVERLVAIMRDGPARGIRVALAAQRLTPDAQALANLTGARLLLAHASRQDFVLAGGEGQAWLAGLPAGAGFWHGRRVQVASGAPRRPADSPALVEQLDDRHLAIVSGRAHALLARLGPAIDIGTAVGDAAALASGAARVIVVGDVDEWQSHWGALGALRPAADIIFDGCSLADYRAITRSRELPPPLGADPQLCWRLNEDGTASRVRLPY
ncbi:MAG: cell division protein [Rhodoglobus sp.]|nr:cell division protein [Rhodoglobus sp.]